MTALEKIAAKARAHQARYPAFDLERFMAWVGEHHAGWQNWASWQTTTRLNKSRRSIASLERLGDSQT